MTTKININGVHELDLNLPGTTTATVSAGAVTLTNTLPLATTSQVGAVKVDGTTITVDGTGKISAASQAPTTHSEPLTDGNSNFIFAKGDVIVVLGVHN